MEQISVPNMFARRSIRKYTKQSCSKEQIKTYEWIETIVVQKDGEQKARIQNRVYYGVDGKVQKVQVSSTTAQQSGRTPRGVRGAIRKKVVENKKEELTDYMKAAVRTVKLYVPPNPDEIKKAREAGKVSFTPLEPGERVGGQPVRLDLGGEVRDTAGDHCVPVGSGDDGCGCRAVGSGSTPAPPAGSRSA
mgnify:CR=1 FL=1